MLHFDSDYMEGAHPEILRRLTETNLEQTPGYGSDRYTVQAREKIRSFKLSLSGRAQTSGK